MKTRIYLLSFLLLAISGIQAQESLWSLTDAESPVINKDGSVTFYYADPAAESVSVSGDFLPPATIDTPSGKMEVQGSAALARDENGVWSYTTAPLAPELYAYTLTVNGIRMLDPANVYVNRDVSSLMNIFIVSRAENDKGDLYSVNDVPHGNVSKVWYDSPSLKMKRRMTVYTPAGYENGKDYPVLYLLHGAGGDEDAWPTLGRTAQIMDNLIAAGKAVPMIVVMPNGNVNCEAAPGEWSKGMYKPTFEGSLKLDPKPLASMDESFKDIVEYVESHYKVAKDRQHRAVCGLSMGGGHSFAIANRYPGMFDYVGLFSAGLHIHEQAGFDKFYDFLKADKDIQDKLAAVFAAKPALYWIAIGNTDFLYQQNSDLRRFLDEKGYGYEYLETDGGHIWRNWRVYLTEFAQRVFK